MSDPRETLPPALRVSIERNTQALTRALTAAQCREVADHFTALADAHEHKETRP